MAERWLPVPGFGDYEVSDIGRVRSIDRLAMSRTGVARWRPGQILKQQQDPKGRMRVGLRIDTMSVTKLVHQLVLAAFVGPRPADQQCRHLNDVPRDNRLVNLAYGTQSENILDLVRNGRHPWRSRTHCPKGHPYDEINTMVIPSRPNARYCRECSRHHERLRRQRVRAS